MATELNELEDAVRWYVEHVRDEEGTDFLTSPVFSVVSGVSQEVSEAHAKRLRRYRKNFDENRDDN